MADQKLTERTTLSETPASGDFFHVVDISDTTDALSGTSKKVTHTNLVADRVAVADKASQAEAEAGTNDTKWMTPLKTKNAIDEFAGIAGMTGATGVQGATGSTGPQGSTGATGAQGDTGDDGATGATGPQGTAGDTGSTGATGAQGTTGATGAGVTGATGSQGAAGATGATGVTGSQGNQGNTGATGVQGATGSQGTTGATGAGVTGATGVQGATGALGSTGATGPQGIAGGSMAWEGAWITATGYFVDDAVENDGSSYICIDDHTSGASTEPGTGASWETVWNLMALKGEDGIIGVDGATGATGPSGSAGAAGATGATGTAGANGATGATGTTGSAGAAGATGATGAGVTGATGVQGATGADGATGATGTQYNWEGAWTTSTTYEVNDCVENDGSGYVCIGDHTSGSTTEPGVGASWEDEWDLFVENGVGATGPAGPTGATGPAGDPGGATGATGTAGSDGATGATGANGTNGATGATGPAGTNGATGATGAGTDGATGATGPVGATGASGGGSSTVKVRFDSNLNFDPTYSTNNGMVWVVTSGSGASSSWQNSTGSFRAISGSSATTTTAGFFEYTTAIYRDIYTQNPRPFWEHNPIYNFVYAYANGGGSTSTRTGDFELTTGGNQTYSATASRLGIKGTRDGDVTTETVEVFNHNGTSSTATDIRIYTNYETYSLSYQEFLTVVVTSGTDIKYYVNGTLRATHTTNLPTLDFTDPYVLYAAWARNTGTTSNHGINLYRFNLEFDAF